MLFFIQDSNLEGLYTFKMIFNSVTMAVLVLIGCERLSIRIYKINLINVPKCKFGDSLKRHKRWFNSVCAFSCEHFLYPILYRWLKWLMRLYLCLLEVFSILHKIVYIPYCCKSIFFLLYPKWGNTINQIPKLFKNNN